MKKYGLLTKQKVETSILVTDGIGTDIMQGAAVGVAAMAVGLIGAWSLSCLVAGVITAGGPMALVSSWFNAVSGF
ncbi:MAG: hypothetical protein OEY01_04075 [Desulfobulbaceae bacterium]|nr:hypothetical protein [Desulfobulbaceae bacterium]HIJ78361.1 hypothetical protein [Deltaproteobacteria bacterium]